MTEEKSQEFSVQALFEKEPEYITAEERKLLIEHYRGERQKFKDLDAKGKVRQMRGKVKPDEASEEELMNKKVLG